jgi:hypothetical protein
MKDIFKSVFDLAKAIVGNVKGGTNGAAVAKFALLIMGVVCVAGFFIYRMKGIHIDVPMK